MSQHKYLTVVQGRLVKRNTEISIETEFTSIWIIQYKDYKQFLRTSQGHCLEFFKANNEEAGLYINVDQQNNFNRTHNEALFQLT